MQPPLDHRPLDLRQVAITHPDALVLIAEVQQEYTRRYGGADATPMDPGEFEPPLGAFFVGYRHDAPVAMGGWRRRPDVTALGRAVAVEVKRMYVVPAARRTGLAQMVLAHLESTARAAGADVMVLETGTEQPEAIALYLAAGYTPVDSFGHYASSPRSRYYGRRL